MFLTGGDPSKILALKQITIDEVYESYYWKRVELLNQIYENIAHTEYLNELEKKK